MKLVDTVVTNVTKFASLSKLKVEKHSPEILMVAGVVGVVATVVVACKETLKADDILVEHERMMDAIDKAADLAKKEAGVEYDEKTVQKDKLVAYTRTVVGFAKLYAPAVALGSLSVACFLVSNRILAKRYLGVVAAYNAVSEAFKSYRERVVGELGEEADHRFRYGETKPEIVAEVDEDGTEKVEEVNKMTVNLGHSDYARYFDESNPNWEKNPLYSRMFLRAQQNLLNDILNTRGYVFLNEVYDALGFGMTQAGAVVGWLSKELGGADGFIDFDIFEGRDEQTRRFINGEENCILLDFNVDGVILDKI